MGDIRNSDVVGRDPLQLEPVVSASVSFGTPGTTTIASISGTRGKVVGIGFTLSTAETSGNAVVTIRLNIDGAGNKDHPVFPGGANTVGLPYRCFVRGDTAQGNAVQNRFLMSVDLPFYVSVVMQVIVTSGNGVATFSLLYESAI